MISPPTRFRAAPRDDSAFETAVAASITGVAATGEHSEGADEIPNGRRSAVRIAHDDTGHVQKEGTRTSGDILGDVPLAEDMPIVATDWLHFPSANLVHNATEVMTDTGQGIRTAATVWTQEDIAVIRAARSGIDGSISERLFRPFVTTKQGGMGLGLAISRSNIESYGGRHSFAPNGGGGTVFQITLPAVARSMEQSHG